jgi:hypothetical protein
MDASSYDEICVNCGATDRSGVGWGKLAEPCPNWIDPVYKENEVFRRVFHHINTHSSITMNAERMQEIIGAICSWSYAHRVGNGELSDEEQQELIDRAFNRIKYIVGVE